jgi:hypothetical protein
MGADVTQARRVECRAVSLYVFVEFQVTQNEHELAKTERD